MLRNSTHGQHHWFLFHNSNAFTGQVAKSPAKFLEDAVSPIFIKRIVMTTIHNYFSIDSAISNICLQHDSYQFTSSGLFCEFVPVIKFVKVRQVHNVLAHILSAVGLDQGTILLYFALSIVCVQQIDVLCIAYIFYRATRNFLSISHQSYIGLHYNCSTNIF